MRRKLIKQDAFEQIANSSVTMVEDELFEAASILSKVLDRDNIQLHSFTESTVLYESDDDSYVHAGYKLDGGKVVFSNIEELVIDEESKAAHRKNILSEMVESVFKEKTEKANSLFKDYLKFNSFNEAKKFVIKSKGDVNAPDFDAEEHDDKKKSPNKLPKKESLFDKIDGKKKRDDDAKEKGGSKGFPFKKAKEDFKKKLKSAGKKVEEAYAVAENVLDYVRYMNLGPAISESVTETDSQGNVVNVKIPNRRARNEGKILSFDWKVLNHKVKVLRSGAASLTEDQEFCKKVAELKVQNNVSDFASLENVLEEIASKWPNVLYLTQEELAHVIGNALNIVGERNFDDNVCNLMAEGILRKVHESYSDRVKQILHFASAPKVQEGADPYVFFQNVVSDFFPYVDHKFGLENKVFEDLYESLAEIYKMAERRGNSALKQETSSYLNDLADVLNDQVRPDIELAEEVASWLANFIESNISGASETWNVTNKPHHTVNGDHPQMARNARVPAIAGTYNGDYGDPAPMIGQEKMAYTKGNAEEARNRSWGNVGGSDTWPTLKNPYVPKPFGDYSMNGEKGVDKDTFGQHHASWQSGDTWPNLKNPYVPKEDGGTGGQGYKMKNGPDTDLIVDKGVNTR